MMMSILFTSQIVLLAVGFGVGYWLLIIANGQENRLKTIGEALGKGIIAATVLLIICNFFYSLMIINNYCKKDYYPINGPVQQYQPVEDQVMPDLNKEQQDGTTDDTDKPENKPVKRNIYDHE